MKRWNTTAGGGLVAAGVERPVAGRPADLYVIDDPYPGIAEAMNPKFRADVWQWFQVNIIPRRKPVLRMIAIMSRWHEDDFIAQLIRHAKEAAWKYRVLDFPAIATCRVEGCDAPQLGFERPNPAGTVSAYIEVCEHGARDELGRLPGEALWPEVRNIEFLKRQLLDVGGTRTFGLGVKRRFARARQSGDLLPDANPNALARLVVAVAWGMAVEAQSGASRSELRKTVEAALSGWPDGAR